MSAPSATRPLAVVTGSSTGIGFELARQFAEHRHDLVVTGGSDRVEGAATELRRLGVEVVAARVDLTDDTASRSGIGRRRAGTAGRRAGAQRRKGRRR